MKLKTDRGKPDSHLESFVCLDLVLEKGLVGVADLDARGEGLWKRWRDSCIWLWVIMQSGLLRMRLGATGFCFDGSWC